MDEIQDDIKSIQEKLEASQFAQITEELDTIRTKYQAQSDESQSRQKEIERLQDDNNRLVTVNGKLFHKLGEQESQPFEPAKESEPEPEPKKIQLSDIITESGDFVKKG